MRIIRSRQYHKLIRALAFFLAVLLLLSGCVGPGDTTEPGKSTDKPSSEQGTSTPSEVVIRTLADQQSEWTEGQFYPGAYQKGSTAFTLPAEPTTFVLEAEGALYAYGSASESGAFSHQVRRLQGIQKKDMLLSEIPEDYRLSGMAVGKDTLFLLAYPTESASETENLLELFIYTSEGIFQSRQKLTDLLDSDQIVVTSVTAFTDLDGSLWIRVPEEGKLYCVRDGQLSQIVTIPTDFQGGFMRGRNADELIAVLGTGTGLVFGKMNTKTGASESYTVEGLPGIQSVFPGTMYDALVMTGKNVYGVSLGEPVVVKELFAFADLGIDGTVLRSMEDHEDGSLSAILLERVKTEGEKISLIPRTTKVREGLVLACLKENDYIRYAVNQYNNEHPDYKITIKEYFDKYAVDTSETDALNRLNSDLMDGTAGDIVCLDGISFAGGGKALLEKGVFLDLYELMDNDPEFNKEDYFTDIFRVNETDGKLYRLVPFFSLNTKYGKVDDVGETTHIDESLLFETEPVTSRYGPKYRRKEFVHDLLVFSLGDFRNQKAPLYDTTELTRYIEVAGKMPDWPDWDGTGEPPEEYMAASSRLGPYDYHDGVVRFFYFSFHDGTYFEIARMAAAVFGEIGMPPHEGISIPEAKRLYPYDVPVAYSGFPVKEGAGSSLINCLSLAVPTSTEASDEAWSFLKCTLSEAYQSNRDLSFTGVPVHKGVFQYYVERMLENENSDDDPFRTRGVGIFADDSKPGLQGYYWYPVLKQYMVDAFVNLLADITLVDEVDPNVEAIVTEEIEKYCDGRQTAEEAARNIAERVELYRDEQ